MIARWHLQAACHWETGPAIHANLDTEIGFR